MRVRSKLLATAAVIAVLGAAAGARADDKTAPNVPGEQGLTSVDKNLNKDSDNRGLTNAQRRIEDNIQDRRDRKAVKADRDDKTAHDKDKARHDRDDKGLRGEKIERAEKVERIEKVDRPERPERPERAGRL